MRRLTPVTSARTSTYCSAGLATVVHELDRQELPGLLKLKRNKTILAQSVIPLNGGVERRSDGVMSNVHNLFYNCI
jgi:hypothetical protein